MGRLFIRRFRLSVGGPFWVGGFGLAAAQWCPRARCHLPAFSSRARSWDATGQVSQRLNLISLPLYFRGVHFLSFVNIFWTFSLLSPHVSDLVFSFRLTT